MAVLDAAEAVAAWLVCGAAHEAGHVLAATALGKGDGILAPGNITDALLRRRVRVPALEVSDARMTALIHHAGWVTSVIVLGAAHAARLSDVVVSVAALTAVEAVASDLFGIYRLVDADEHDAKKHGVLFRCGNFGVRFLLSCSNFFVFGYEALLSAVGLTN